MHRYRGLIIKLLVSIFTFLLLLGLPLNTLAQEDFEVYLPIILSDGSGDSSPPLLNLPDLPPSNFAALIDQNVTDGIWTEAKGIVQILKLLNEEVPPEDIPGLDTVVFGEATGVVSLANEYLADNPDPTLAAEIERLLGTIFPPQANLDYYSAPITSTTSSLTGVQAADAQACDLAWKEGSPTTGSAPTCLFFNSFELDGKTFKIYYPAKWQGDNNKLEYFAAAFNAMSASYGKYQPYGEVPATRLVFAPVTGTGTNAKALAVTDANAVLADKNAVCPVTVFPGAFNYPLAPKQFQQIVAHEMFHCFQAATLPKQWGPSYKAIAWWVEGTAEYFSNEVYPQADREQVQWLNDFNILSAYQPIILLDYENFIFFQYLGNRFENEGVLNLIRTMPTTHTTDTGAQTRHLAKYPDIHNIFQQFGQDYFDGKIMDSSEDAIPSDALPLHFTSEMDNKGTVFFAETGDLAEFPAHVFRLTRHALVYERGKRFDQLYQLDSARHVVKPLLIGEIPTLDPTLSWGTLPTEIDANCKDGERYFLLLTNIDRKKQDPFINFKNSVTVLEENSNCCYFDARLGGAVADAYKGPSFYNLTSPSPLLITALYEQWVSQTAVPNYTPGMTGTVTAQGFTLTDNASGLSVGMAQDSDEVTVTVDESQSDFIKGRMHGTVTDLSVGGGGNVSLFAEFKAAKSLSELANQCDLEWE